MDKVYSNINKIERTFTERVKLATQCIVRYLNNDAIEFERCRERLKRYDKSIRRKEQYKLQKRQGERLYVSIEERIKAKQERGSA